MLQTGQLSQTTLELEPLALAAGTGSPDLSDGDKTEEGENDDCDQTSSFEAQYDEDGQEEQAALPSASYRAVPTQGAHAQEDDGSAGSQEGEGEEDQEVESEEEDQADTANSSGEENYNREEEEGQEDEEEEEEEDEEEEEEEEERLSVVKSVPSNITRRSQGPEDGRRR
jgi:hypothetical protein